MPVKTEETIFWPNADNSEDKLDVKDDIWSIDTYSGYLEGIEIINSEITLTSLGISMKNDSS